MRINEFGQAIGDELPDFTPGRLPAIERIEGRYTVIERLSKEKHGADLYQVYGPASPADMWTYLFNGPAEPLDDPPGTLLWSQAFLVGP